jgi:uncharacterized lipoprotein YmbA
MKSLKRPHPLRHGALTLGLACIVGCSTPAPERFHSLIGRDTSATETSRSAEAGRSSTIHVDVMPVSVPAQVDHAQWVVRQADDTLLMLEQERWAAPLGEELRGAIAGRLAGRWGVVNVHAVAAPPAPVWRVRVDVQRFESVPGREARIDSIWSLSPPSPPSVPAVVCRTSVREGVIDNGAPALAAAHRRAVAQLADRIGAQLRAMQAGEKAICETAAASSG